MAFSPKVWQNGPLGGTPLDAAGQIDQETRLSGYTDAETTRALAAEAAIQAAAAQGLVPTAVKTGAYTVAATDFVPVDISAGSVALALPAAPADKARVGVKVVKLSGTPGSTSCTITRGGSDVFNIAAGSTSLTLTALFQGVILQYKSSSGIWYVSTADTPLGVALGAAKLGTDNTIGGPSGSSLSPSVELTTSPGRIYNPLNPPGGANYAAIADGNSHPLSERFATLAAARLIFPRAASTAEEIDRHALQFAYDTQSHLYVPEGLYICDVRSCAVTQVAWTASGGGAGTVTITAPNHGYTGADVAAGHTFRVGGWSTDSLSNDWTWFTTTGTGWQISSVPDANTLTFSVASGGPTSSIAGNAPSGTTAAVRLKAALFTRSADSGSVYGNGGESAKGLGSQEIEMDKYAVLQLRAGANDFGHAGVVLASGNVRTVSVYSQPANTVPFCPDLVVKLQVDGNRANASVTGNEPGIFLVGASDLDADIDAYNAGGTGCLHYGISGSYTQRQRWELRCHDNGTFGFQNSFGTRTVRYDPSCIAYHNGLSAAYTGGQLLGGFNIDHSEAQIPMLTARDNAGPGIMIHNVYDHNIPGLWARGNGGHGIWVIGFVASSGGAWYSTCNGQAAINTYDDVHFDNESDLTYGVSKTSHIANIVCGFDGRADYTNKARYSLAVDTGMGDISLKVRYLAAGNSGNYSGPLSGTAGANGGLYLYERADSKVTIRKPVDQTINNSNVLTNDVDLKFAVDANEVCKVDVWLLAQASSPNADWQLAWSVPAGCSGFWAADAVTDQVNAGFVAKGVAATVTGTVALTTPIPLGGVAATQLIHVVAFITNGATAGTVNLQWAQNTATVENNTVKTGSLILVERF